MNKLNLLLLIALVLFASSCEKIEVPEPTKEDPEFGFWSGQIGASPLSIENDSLFMSTKIISDALNVNTYQTSFTMLGSTQPQWIFKYRDSKTMRTAADTSDLFYTGTSRYLHANQVGITGRVVSHTLKNILHGNAVIWDTMPDGQGDGFTGGRHFSIENTRITGVNHIKASLIVDGKNNYVYKKYVPLKGDINIKTIKISGNKITFDLDQSSVTSSLRFIWNDGAPGWENTFEVSSSGLYNLKISDEFKDCFVEIQVYLERSKGTIKQPDLPIFSSIHTVEYSTLPNFSKMEIIYFDKDGTEYSTRYLEQFKPFIIKNIETFDKTNQQGQKVKKLDVEFSVKLQTADGSKSIDFTGVKGDIGFAYE